MITNITTASYNMPHIKRENVLHTDVIPTQGKSTKRETFGLKMFETMDDASYKAFKQATDGMDDLQKLSLAAGMEIRAINAHINTMYDYNTDPKGWENAFVNMKSKGFDMSQTEPLLFLQHLSNISKNIPDGNTKLIEVLDTMVSSLSKTHNKIDTYM